MIINVNQQKHNKRDSFLTKTMIEINDPKRVNRQGFYHLLYRQGTIKYLYRFDI